MAASIVSAYGGNDPACRHGGRRSDIGIKHDIVRLGLNFRFYRERAATHVVALALMISFIQTPSAGMEISRTVRCDSGDVLRLRGDIGAGDYAKFRSHFGGDRRIVGLDLDSPGGSLYEGVRIAKLTQQKRLWTFVAKECDSACAFIFLLGSKRYVSGAAKIGVHAVGNDYGAEDNGTIRDTIHFARLSADLGIPSSIIGKMVATPPSKIALLGEADLAALRVIVRDPLVRNARASDDACRSDTAKETSVNNEVAASARVSRKPKSRSEKRSSPVP